MKKRCIKKRLLSGLGDLLEINTGADAEVRYNLVINEEMSTYGLEIEKWSVSDSGATDCEFSIFPNIAKDEGMVSALILKMSENFVTPIQLQDVLEDLNLI